MEALATSVEEVSSAVFQINEEVSPVVEKAFSGVEVGTTPKVVPVKETGGKRHTAKNLYCRKKSDVCALAGKIERVRRDKPVVVDARTDVAMKAVAAEAVSDNKSIGRNSSGVEHGTKARVTRPRSLQATGNIEVDAERKFGERKKLAEADVADELVNSVSNEATRSAARSHASLIPSSCVKDPDLVALCTHIQKLQFENEGMLARRARNQNIQMETILKRCLVEKKSGASELEVKRLTQQPAEVCAAKEKDVVERQAMKNTVAAKEFAKKQVLALTEKLVPVSAATEQLSPTYCRKVPRDVQIFCNKVNASYGRWSVKGRMVGGPSFHISSN